MQIENPLQVTSDEVFQGQIQESIKYCLYSRKSSESDEKQALSIDAQIKEMTEMAVAMNLEITEIRKESHSARDVGKRPVFNSIIEDIKVGKFNGILTWAPVTDYQEMQETLEH